MNLLCPQQPDVSIGPPSRAGKRAAVPKGTLRLFLLCRCLNSFCLGSRPRVVFRVTLGSKSWIQVLVFPLLAFLVWPQLSACRPFWSGEVCFFKLSFDVQLRIVLASAQQETRNGMNLGIPKEATSWMNRFSIGHSISHSLHLSQQVLSS